MKAFEWEVGITYSACPLLIAIAIFLTRLNEKRLKELYDPLKKSYNVFSKSVYLTCRLYLIVIVILSIMRLIRLSRYLIETRNQQDCNHEKFNTFLKNHHWYEQIFEYLYDVMFYLPLYMILF